MQLEFTLRSFNPEPEATACSDAGGEPTNADASGCRLNEQELLAKAERDLDEAESIAERGSMLACRETDG